MLSLGRSAERVSARKEVCALASQGRGIGNLEKVSVRQATASSEEWFGASRADALREQYRRSKAASSVSSPSTGSAPTRTVSVQGAAPVASASASPGVLALDVACFRTRSARMTPAPGQANCRLLEPLPVDTAQRVYGIPSAALAMSGWYACLRPFGGLRNLGNTCFVNATVQVLARVEGFVQCLRMHTHGRARPHACVLCALRGQMEELREGRRVERDRR